MPTLLYLPNLTPVEESLVLLPAAYSALGVLCDVRFDGGEKVNERFSALDRVMRQGVFMGYNHASEHPAIMQVLLEQMKILVEKMGLHAVKHLKVLLLVTLFFLCCYRNGTDLIKGNDTDNFNNDDRSLRILSSTALIIRHPGLADCNA